MNVNNKIKTLIKYNAEFKYYRQGELWYSIITDDEEFMFPVPITDTGTGVFYKKDRGVVFMRWIRKQLINIEDGKIEQGI